jgi:hypothetical protein
MENWRGAILSARYQLTFLPELSKRMLSKYQSADTIRLRQSPVRSLHNCQISLHLPGRMTCLLVLISGAITLLRCFCCLSKKTIREDVYLQSLRVF